MKSRVRFALLTTLTIAGAGMVGCSATSSSDTVLEPETQQTLVPAFAPACVDGEDALAELLAQLDRLTDEIAKLEKLNSNILARLEAVGAELNRLVAFVGKDHPFARRLIATIQRLVGKRNQLLTRIAMRNVVLTSVRERILDVLKRTSCVPVAVLLDVLLDPGTCYAEERPPTLDPAALSRLATQAAEDWERAKKELYQRFGNPPAFVPTGDEAGDADTKKAFDDLTAAEERARDAYFSLLALMAEAVVIHCDGDDAADSSAAGAGGSVPAAQ